MSSARASVATIVAFLLAGGVCGCGTTPDTGVDGDGDGDGDGDVDGDTDTAPDADSRDADPDVDLDLPPGPATFIIDEAEILAERRCDLDGDGTLDNAVADLGSPSAELFVIALNSALAGALQDRLRAGFHLPWVDDLGGMNDDVVTLINFEANDADDPEDPTDDFFGESFWADPDCLDACGEPLYLFTEARLERGTLTGSDGTIVLPLANRMIGHGARLTGTVAPGAASIETVTCAYALISELGTITDPHDWGDLSALEVLLTGGAVMGLHSVPGLTPDIDLDDDGLESFVTDEELRITTCIDGDHSTVSGRDCWQDERFADAVSMTIRLHGVPAGFLGREEDWREHVTDECVGGPPETSLFDPS